VARLLDRLGLVNDLLDGAELATEALDDRMVADLAATAGTLGEAADGLATRETVSLAETVGAEGEDLAAGLATLARLQREGTLDDLAELGDAASLATAALDDEMVTTLARTGGSLGELADTAADPETVQGMQTLLRAVGDASDPDAAEPVGALGLVGALRDPEVKRGMGFLLAVARATGRELDQ
jgi:uncharacterized protein YjgD (DUF1641 family)